MIPVNRRTMQRNDRQLCCVISKDIQPHDRVIEDKACSKPVLGSLLPRIPIRVIEDDSIHGWQVGAQAT